MGRKKTLTKGECTGQKAEESKPQKIKADWAGLLKRENVPHVSYKI